MSMNTSFDLASQARRYRLCHAIATCRLLSSELFEHDCSRALALDHITDDLQSLLDAPSNGHTHNSPCRYWDGQPGDQEPSDGWVLPSFDPNGPWPDHGDPELDEERWILANDFEPDEADLNAYLDLAERAEYERAHRLNMLVPIDNTKGRP